MAAKLHVQDAIDAFSKCPLLCGRLHNDKNGATVTEPIAFRLVTAPEHRKVLASLLLADYPLAEAQLRCTDVRGRHKKIPREWRLCCFCMADVEDSLHALFACGCSNELINLRTMFWNKFGPRGELTGAIRTPAPKDILHRMLLSKRLVLILAEYSLDVLKVFEKVVMFVDSEAHWYGQDAPGDRRPCALDAML